MRVFRAKEGQPEVDTWFALPETAMALKFGWAHGVERAAGNVRPCDCVRNLSPYELDVLSSIVDAQLRALDFLEEPDETFVCDVSYE